MRPHGLTISRYILKAVLPYFLFTWLLLSVILFVQQAGRYSDVLFSTSLPGSLLWQLTIALIPNVIAFTCPVAVLVGVIIGLSKLQGDSEMVALRAAGVGNLQIALPMILLGILLSLFALFINLKGVPVAAQIVRQVALKAALYKLESPVEPGSFNSEISDFTIYVREGNVAKGTWEDLFIHQFDRKNGLSRLITAKEGRIDTSGEETEIVLKDAHVTTLPENRERKIVREKVGDFRLEVNTRRGELIEKLSKTKETPEEMGLRELRAHIDTLSGTDRTEAYILWQRRIILSVTPLIFALLGTALVAKFNRGGRGFGVLLSLVSLVAYYLLTLLGEQLARTGAIGVRTAGLIPLGASILAIAWLFLSRRLYITRNISLEGLRDLSPFARETSTRRRMSGKSAYMDMTTGIMDFDLVGSLLKNYLLTLSFLILIFLIFTAFELWKFAGTFENGVQMLLAYLFYLIPFVYVQIAPSALMIATLATYVIKSRQNEIVTWTAAGQSIYRLLLPCFVLMGLIGLLNFGFQETILPSANRTQDALRDQIRSRNTITGSEDSLWVATDDRILSFDLDSASDNEKRTVRNLRIYEFGPDRRIGSVLRAEEAQWETDSIRIRGRSELIRFGEGSQTAQIASDRRIEVEYDPFRDNLYKPSHMGIGETERRLELAESGTERRTYAISLQKKYTTLFIPLVVILFTAPFALSLGRKGNVLTIGYAIGFWLLFMGIVSIFEQFGQSGYLPPALAVWSPLILFTVIGLYMLTRVRT